MRSIGSPIPSAFQLELFFIFNEVERHFFTVEKHKTPPAISPHSLILRFLRKGRMLSQARRCRCWIPELNQPDHNHQSPDHDRGRVVPPQRSLSCTKTPIKITLCWCVRPSSLCNNWEQKVAFYRRTHGVTMAGRANPALAPQVSSEQ